MQIRFDPRWFDTLVVGGVVGVLYAFTAAPDLYYTDCGELAGVCTTLGVAHPTGYPLFTLLAHGWQMLPLPLSPIGKLNVLMIVLGCCAAIILHRTLLRLLPQVSRLETAATRSIAAIGTLLFASARTIWAQALSLEVHALQVLLVCSLLYWLLRWGQTRRRRDAIIAGVMVGLCFTNHLTSVVLLPAVLVYVLSTEQGKFVERLRRLTIPTVVTFSCGLLYAYLPLRSLAEPLFNWGEVHRSVDKFLYHVLGKQYSVWMFSGSARQQLEVFWQLLLPNSPMPLALVGLWKLWKQNRRLALLFVLLVVVCVAYVINYGIHDIEPYFVTAFVTLALATAVGLAVIWRFRLVRVMALLLPVIYTGWNWRSNDLHAHWLVRQYVKLVVDPLPHGSILLSQQWDYFCSAFWYMQQVEGYRPDVVLIEKELLRRTWYLHQLVRWYGEPIRRCSSEIATYMPLLEEFESGAMPKERYGVIQRAFIGLLTALVERNRDRFAFVTPEVLETEPDFATAVRTEPYGATLAIIGRNGQSPPLPQVVDPTLLRQAAARYTVERLDRGIVALAAQAYVRTGDALVSHARDRALECYRIALRLDQRNLAARERLRRYSGAQ